MADGDVDAVEFFGFVFGVDFVPGLLVEDRVEGDGGFAGLTVANDEFSLASADGDHGVDGFEACHHGLNVSG